LGLDYEPVLVQQPATLDEMHDIGNGIMYGEPAPVQEPDLIDRLKHPEDHYEFTDPKKANAVLMSLCQEAADALAAPVQEPVAWAMYQQDRLQSFWLDKGDAYDFEFTPEHRWEPLYTTPPAQPAPEQPVAFEVGLVEWVGNKLMATPKTTTTPPASWVEMVTANLVREGVNKHKARELAEHFYGLAQRPFVGLTDEELREFDVDPVEAKLMIAKLKEKNNG
jgi:hypothetical protein